MNSKKTVLGLLVAAIALLGAPAASQAATITLSGSTTVAPLATQLAKAYVKGPGKGTKFKLLQGGSDVGVADVARGRVTLGMSSRIPKGSDPGGIVFNEIAKDALCVVTNPDNAVPAFTEELVQNIFSGTIRDWSNVPGAKRSGTIDVIVRTAASGTQDAFLKIFMGSKKVFAGASQKASNGLIQQAVARNSNAIGYVGHSFTKGTTVGTYKGVPCTLRAAKSGQYPGTRPLFLVSRGPLSGAAQDWVQWIRTNPVALRIAATDWVPFQ